MSAPTKTRKDPEVKVTEMPADEARQCLGDLLDRAGFLGELIVITRRGKPIAVLVGGEEMRRLIATG